MNTANDGDDSDSFSSDSDDEFLTKREDGKEVDREALVRKKLLESFYGKSAFINGGDSADNDSDDDDDGDDDNQGNKTTGKPPARRSRSAAANNVDPSTSADLDSPHFDPVGHTERHVLHDSVHPLLETEESLACQVRTLDSSMQTLVYENYSRFIEATDAIRSIGVNVQANQSNLQKLSTSIATVGETARDVELACGSLRDSVVEKIRVKRLLKRLDALLKLPATLQENIQVGRYRWATKSYLTAYSILNKHSAGFESLQRIETECHGIVDLMLIEVKAKLVHWSGNLLMGENSSSNNNDNEFSDDDDNNQAVISNSLKGPSPSQEGDPPDPPKTVAEIFECAGTPMLILNHQSEKMLQGEEAAASAAGAGGGDAPAIAQTTSMVEFDPGMTVNECKDMSLSACLRLLERFLDTHHIELQESLFGSSSRQENFGTGTTGDFLLPQGTPPGARNVSSSSSSGQLIPTSVLDSILEAAALYSMTFPSIGGRNSDQLSHFVSMAFSSFLQHVRGEFLEQAMQAYPKDLKRMMERQSFDDSEGPIDPQEINKKEEPDGEDDPQESDEKAYEHISNATTLLLDSVRQLASGLALPEIAVAPDLASSLVDLTVGLSVAMLKKRVDQKFYMLRIRVIEECLAPFSRNSLQEKPGIEKDRPRGTEAWMQIARMASVALSDAMQLVDDTVRSILATANDEINESSSSSSKNEDYIMLKVAVEQSTQRFANWLAEAMETMAGCDSSEPGRVINAFPDPSGQGGAVEEMIKTVTVTVSALPRDLYGEEKDDLTQFVEDCMARMLATVAATGSAPAKSNFTLAIGEMCREAERKVMDDIAQSIATHTGSSNKQRGAKAAGLFATGPGGSGSKSSSPSSDRFRLAASRVLSLYAMNRGSEAAGFLCSTLTDLSEDGQINVDGPRRCSWTALTVVKTACIECGDLFGSSKRADPISDNLEDEYPSLTAGRQQQAFRSGLVSDVERMFAEKVVVYPNPFEILEPQRNAVIAVVLKVAFKGVVEDVRLIRFSIDGYRQLLVDLEFLKFMITHYVGDEHFSDGSNARSILESLLKEAQKCAKDRCNGSAMLLDETSETNQARAVVRQFMAENSGDRGILGQFTIAEDD